MKDPIKIYGPETANYALLNEQRESEFLRGSKNQKARNRGTKQQTTERKGNASESQPASPGN